MTTTPRRTVLAAALAVAGTATTVTNAAARSPGGAASATTVDYRDWTSIADWLAGTPAGIRLVGGPRPGIAMAQPTDTVEYADPHSGKTRRWEYATWLSPVHRAAPPASELVASWNAHTPAGTWLRVEVLGTYNDGARTPWYTLGAWASGDCDIRRASVDDQSDGASRVRTDTLALDDTSSPLRLVAYQLRLTLYRAPGCGATPTVWRLGAMTSDVPDRFEVPASAPGAAAGVELPVPRYSQQVHLGRYPEYDNGGEAWCSPASSQMVIEYWGRAPTAEDLAWVDPDYDDPQVCHAARLTYDHQYEGCGNWSFNAAYAATYPDLQAVVTRIGSLSQAEDLVRAGVPLIVSLSFHRAELTGAGYGTSGHLMTVIGFTGGGDVVANDPAGADSASVRRVYRRRQFENLWLRTRRRAEDGTVTSGTGGVCYLAFPVRLSPTQRRALAAVGVMR